MSRESDMVVIRRDDDGKPTVWCDPTIADLVEALNTGELATVASCSGHGHRPGNIALADGRVLVVCSSLEEAQIAEAPFGTDINGHPVPRPQAVQVCPNTDAVCPHGAGCPRPTGRYACPGPE